MDNVVRDIPPAAAQRLRHRARLAVDARKSIAVKRDVHELIVEADLPTFVAAFRDVMTDPNGTFGLIRVRRPADRLGRDFTVGERFQGCYSIATALSQVSQGSLLAGVVDWALSTRVARQVLTAIEDAMLSDYAVIEELVLEPAPGQPAKLRYGYLDGTPIAGSSVFTVEDIGGGQLRVTQVFEYQEINSIALATFQRFGLKMHDQVVFQQIHKAAERAGGRLVSATIPGDYVEQN